MIKKYTNFNINETNTDAKCVDIKNEYTKIINDPKSNAIDLGVVDDVSDTDIKNIQQTYKNSSIKVADGHYILFVGENNVIKYSEFENIDEGLRNKISKYFKFNREPHVTDDVLKYLHQTNGIASELGLGGSEPREYDQILYAYDNGGFESLSNDWKEKFIKMVDLADLWVSEKGVL